MSYARKTFEDRNAVKRYFQNSRLTDAMALGATGREPGTIVDFGAGNGELCRRLAQRFPRASIHCYEPHPGLLAEAVSHLNGLENVHCTDDAASLGRACADLLFCLEVFEHLPRRETAQAMDLLEGLLAPGGVAVIGVPVEIGLPALYKGAFRMWRHFGAFDARLANIAAAAIGRPPADRPVVELMPGSCYHLHHLGFDHRRFRALLARRFRILRSESSPFPLFGTAINSEVHYLVEG